MYHSLELVRKYAPIVYFDEKEPFFPIRVGFDIFHKDGSSASFNRSIRFYDDSTSFVIEYSIYWDFDIQHLYELEHIWVYVDKNGEVCECESSFHGDFFRSLLKDRSNIEEGTHVIVYSQPGKHAFFPAADLFNLLPRQYLYEPAYEYAGADGLIVPGFLRGAVQTDDRINDKVRKYLERFRFRPSMHFVKYLLPDNIFIPWDELKQQIPGLIEAKLREIEYAMNDGE